MKSSKDRNIFQRVNDFAVNTAEKIAGIIIKDEYEEIITLQLCIDLVKQERKNNNAVRYFTLSVKENEVPVNDNDRLTVRLRLEDISRNALMRDYVFHTAEIDGNMTELLDGKESVTVKI